MEPVSAFTAASAYLFMKMFLNSIMQAYARFRGAGFNYPEDYPFGGKHDSESPLAELEFRATAAWRNDLENIPIFLVGALCGLLNGIPAQPYALLLGAFCFFRTLHTFFLVKGKQPWRFLTFVSGTTVMGVMFLWSLRLAGF